MTAATHRLHDHLAPAPPRDSLFHRPRIALDWLSRRMALARSRAVLQELDGRLLADVALDRAAARAEAAKGFWG
ncbi:MAG: hypothetical protein IPK81_24250 [Rhodospirillales bacterium]|nr:MAG: hypothetical protein IPK81_24250 [Rhodospirillales bacterium]